MTLVLDPDQRESIKEKILAVRKRKLIKRFSGPNGLLEFVKHFWHVLEPQTPFVDGWPLWAICEHLQAVSDGRINRLLINVPPGFMKSLLVDVYWPAWEWAVISTHFRYVSFSYSSLLTERDNRRFGALVTCPEYQEMFGDKVRVVKLGDKMVSNTGTGWKLASSVGGVGTGERGDRIICLPFSQRIMTDIGDLPIGEIVSRRLPVRVWGYDEASGACGWQEIEKYERNPAGPIYEIAFDGGAVRCTGDHPVFVDGRGFIRADMVREGQCLRTFNLSAMRNRDQTQAKRTAEVLFQVVPQCVRSGGREAKKQPTVLDVRQAGVSATISPSSDAREHLLQPQVPWSQQSRHRKSCLSMWSGCIGLQMVWQKIRGQAWQCFVPRMLFAFMFRKPKLGKWLSRARAAIGLSSLQEEISGKTQEDQVLFAGVCGYYAFGADEGRRQRTLCARGMEEGVSARMERQTQGVHSGSRWQRLQTMWGGEAGSQSGRSPHKLREGGSRPEQPDNALQDVSRPDARTPSAKSDLARTVVRSVKCLGAIETETFNLRVAPFHNYFAEGVLLHNCDDPHNVKEAESEIIRSETVRWFRESMSNRLNDMEKGAIIVIMQRLHSDDCSGVILEKGMAYDHLMIPMVYDYERQTTEEFDPVTTSIGWYDPRYDEYDPNEPEDLLAWPERFPQRVWDAIQVDIGPYAVAGQYGQSPVPRGGGIFKRDWWQLWDNPEGKFPVFDYLVASLDSAFTEKERNDPSALTIWGVFTLPNSPGVTSFGEVDSKTGHVWQTEFNASRQRVMLVHAWRKFLQFSGPRSEIEPLVGESRMQWVQRTQPHWGLVEWVKYSCERFKVDNLLIEAKASGISASQELANRYGRLSFGVQLMSVKGSKEARALAAQPTFSQLLVYAPAREWAEEVITEMEVFPKGKYMDLTDSTTQAMKFLRDNDLLIDDSEQEAREREQVTHVGKKQTLSFW